MIVAGIGCRRGCTAEAIAALVRAAADRAACRIDRLAAPEFKRDEPGLHGAVRLLGMPLTFVDQPGLAAVQGACPTRSELAAARFGVASVAEAAALAASGGTLLLARITDGAATCALARQ